MKIFASTEKSIVILQLLSILLIFIGLVYPVDFSTYYVLLSVFMFYCYSIFGISMMLHRFYTHKTFKLNPITKYFFTIFAILAGRGSPLGWTYVHRMHHATSDTMNDPHSPHNKNFKFIGFKPIKTKNKINHFIIKDLMNPVQLSIDKYYMLYIITFLLILYWIDFNLVFYMWAIPVVIVSISQTCFNYFAHTYGYRNFNTKDKSTNNIFLWPFILGDAWHNNHHANAEKISTKINKYEFDPIALFINLIKK